MRAERRAGRWQAALAWPALAWLALAWPAPALGEATPAPRRVDVTLREYTAMNVVLVPDLGTRFSFPFALDDPGETAPFTLTMTNPVFVHHREPGRRFFTVEIDPQEGQRDARYLGNLFVSVRGYHLSVALSSSLDTRTHVTDYVFSLPATARKQLIQEAVRERAAALERQHRQRLDDLDRRAAALALARLANALAREPGNRAIRERGVLSVEEGEVELRLDRMQRYGKEFFVFHYQLRNEAAVPIAVQDVALLLVDQTGQLTPVPGASSPLRSVPVGARRRARFATDVGAVDDRRYRLELRVQTSLGPVAVRW